MKVKEVSVYQELMQNELLVLEKTDHPHITRVFELLEDARKYYIVMEYLTGGSLLERIIKMGQFGETQAAKILH